MQEQEELMTLLIFEYLIDPIDQCTDNDKNKERTLEYHRKYVFHFKSMPKNQSHAHEDETDYYYDAFGFELLV
jgi:hypothetical protein